MLKWQSISLRAFIYYQQALIFDDIQSVRFQFCAWGTAGGTFPFVIAD